MVKIEANEVAIRGRPTEHMHRIVKPEVCED